MHTPESQVPANTVGVCNGLTLTIAHYFDRHELHMSQGHKTACLTRVSCSHLLAQGGEFSIPGGEQVGMRGGFCQLLGQQRHLPHFTSSVSQMPLSLYHSIKL